METLLVSIVTAPFRAKALPDTMLAPLFRVMLVSFRAYIDSKLHLLAGACEFAFGHSTLAPPASVAVATPPHCQDHDDHQEKEQWRHRESQNREEQEEHQAR